jgi:ribonuclease HI
VDGAFSGQGQAGAGIILHDDRGKVIIAACIRHDKCQDALEAELLAIEEGLQLSLH